MIKVNARFTQRQCLKEIQTFIDFCNFYQCFIENFLKIVHFMIKLTQKNMFFN